MTLALLVLAPLAGAALIALAGSRLPRWGSGVIASGVSAIAFGAAASIVPTMLVHPELEARAGEWLPLPGADWALVLDSGTLAIALTVTGIATLAALASIPVIATGSDPPPPRYFAALALSVAATLLVVLASNLILVLAGWSLLGAATAGLGGATLPRAAAVRAFVLARAGEAALLIGALLFFVAFRTVDIAQLAGLVLEHGGAADALVLVASAFVVGGAVARSAQLPLHAWLVDLVDLPAPAAALMQSTSVTVGVVLLVRLRAILAPDVLFAAALIGGITAVVGAVVALAERDVRRALAWTTVSQVGLMFVGAGVGAIFATRFHLIAHALAKAALVLGVDRRRLTILAFAAAGMSLAALPPASGFLSTEEIAAAALGAPFLVACVLLTTALTAFVVARLVVLLFVAPVRESPEPHPRPPLVAIPQVLLAVAAFAFGALVTGGLLPIGGGHRESVPLLLAGASFALALAGAAVAWTAFRRGVDRAASLGRVTARAASLVRRGPLALGRWVSCAPSLALALERGARRIGERARSAIATEIRRSARAAPPSAEPLLVAGVVVLLAYWTYASWAGR